MNALSGTLTAANIILAATTISNVSTVAVTDKTVTVKGVHLHETSYACMGDCGSPPDTIWETTYTCAVPFTQKTRTGRIDHPPAPWPKEVWDK